MRLRAGKNRQPWRIREWLDAKGMTLTDVGNAVGVNRQLASETVRGLRNNKRILTHLRDMGCPERFLDLPEQLKAKEVA